ncbi:MAG: hypothetical protein J7578_11360, partial [Chitinophagaceae bacterium]|nr:hypothetical protein [Chitinophagaceae bacterium]
MVPDHEHISKLWALYLSDQASPEQVDELFLFISDQRNDAMNLQFYQQLTGEDGTGDTPADPSKAAAVLQSLVEENAELKVLLGHKFQRPPENTVEQRFKISRRGWIAFAAVWLLLVIGQITWY